MNRRNFLKLLGAASVAAGLPAKALASSVSTLAVDAFQSVNCVTVTKLGNGWAHVSATGTMNRSGRIGLTVADGEAVSFDGLTVENDKEYTVSFYAKSAGASHVKVNDAWVELPDHNEPADVAPDGTPTDTHIWGVQLEETTRPDRFRAGASNLIPYSGYRP